MKALSVIPAALLLLAASCSSIRDISDAAGELSDYVVGATYALRQPVLLARGALWPFGTLGTSPDARQFDPDRAPAVERVIPAGTQLVVRSIEIHTAPELGHCAEVVAELRDGVRGAGLVTINGISSVVSESGATLVRPDLLERIVSQHPTLTDQQPP